MKCFSERARHRPDEGWGDGGPFERLYPLMASNGHKRAALLATPAASAVSITGVRPRHPGNHARARRQGDATGAFPRASATSRISNSCVRAFTFVVPNRPRLRPSLVTPPWMEVIMLIVGVPLEWRLLA
jgi:hypothetical protein